MLHEKRTPKVSIIMPCYNHGKFIDDAIQSIDRITDKNLYEVIIVNDGSTDSLTIERLEYLAKTGLYKVVNQENQGVCVAKNNGMALARGEYILPVDSDNMLRPEFISEALPILENDPDISIVYSDYYLFGSETGIRKSGPYNLQRIMLDNFVENCSMFRKSMIDKIGGFDTFLSRVGIEDWELWLRASFNGYKFHYIEKPLFDYRVLEQSRNAHVMADKTKGNTYTDYFMKKFPEYYGQQYVDKYILDKFRTNFGAQLSKLTLMIYFPNVFKKMVAKGKLRKYF